MSQTPAFVRTGTPIAAGPILVAVARTFGLEVTVEQALLIVPVASFAYYCTGRALEMYNPKLGYILGIAKTPAYSSQPAPSPGPGEDVAAVVVPDGHSDDTVQNGYDGYGASFSHPEPEPESDMPVLDEPVQSLTSSTVRSVPLAEVRKVAKRVPAKKAAPRKRAPKKPSDG